MLIDPSKKSQLTSSVDGYKSRLTIRVVDSFKQKVELQSGGKNTVVYDNNGVPSIMVVVPRMNYEQLNLPGYNLGTGVMSAFVTNGVPRSEILIGKYLSNQEGSNIPGTFVSKRTQLSTAKNICINKGPNWHVMSVHEWAMLCLLNGSIGYHVKGNNQFGGSSITKETGVRLDGLLPFTTTADIGDAIIRNGSSPTSFSHDGTIEGVFDIVGQGLEFIDQIELRNGQIFTTPDNQPYAPYTSYPCFLDADREIPEGSTAAAKHVLSNTIVNYHGPLDSTRLAHNRDGRWFEVLHNPTYVPNQHMRRLLIECASPTLDAIKGNWFSRNNGIRAMAIGGTSSDIALDPSGNAAAYMAARSFARAPDDPGILTANEPYVFRTAYFT